MKMLVLGAGTVGRSIANMLCDQKHDVTVVDSNPDLIRQIKEETSDMRAITGSASHSSVLFQAGVIDADVCLAVTGVDEVNLVAASLAKEMGARRAIARIYASVFRDLSTFDYHNHFKIDRMLSLEHLSAMNLARGIRSDSSVILENLARGDLEVRELTVGEHRRLVGKPLREWKMAREVRVAAITRNGQTFIARGDHHVEPGDRITLIGDHDAIEELAKALEKEVTSKVRVIIAGGGETGYHLAQILQSQRYRVTLIEQDEQRAKFLGRQLADGPITVVQADATQRSHLEQERVADADVFAACTGDDENNIIACVEAKDIGARRTMAIVSRPDYASIVKKLGIDHTVSPRQVMADEVRALLNEGALIYRRPIGMGHLFVLEYIVLEGAPVTQGTIAQLPLPEQCLLAAVVRQSFVRVLTGEDRLEVGDSAVVLAADSALPELNDLFTPQND